MPGYSRIASAIHNFGDSFVSLTNYVCDGYVIDDLNEIHAQGLDIEIDWLSGAFEPADVMTPRLAQSVEQYRRELDRRLAAEAVELERITSLRFVWPARQRKRMVAVDDRGSEHVIYVREYA